MKTVNLVQYFNGLFMTIFGVVVLDENFGNTPITGWVKWVVGLALIANGIIGMSPIFKVAFVNIKQTLFKTPKN